MTPANAFQYAALSLERRNFGLGQHVDVRQRGDPVDEITRHGRRQVRAPDEKRELGDLTGEIYYRLARRVAGAHECDLLLRAELPLQRRSPVVNGGGLEIRKI